MCVSVYADVLVLSFPFKGLFIFLFSLKVIYVCVYIYSFLNIKAWKHVTVEAQYKNMKPESQWGPLKCLRDS